MARTKDIVPGVKLLRLDNPQFDPQRGSVYRMEREWVGQCIATFTMPEYMEEIGVQLCDLYHVELPTLKIVDAAPHIDDMAEYNWADATITLWHPNGAQLISYLHELAHHITAVLYGDTSHGPIFCAVYRYLLYKSRCVSKEAFNFAADKWGVEIHWEDRPSALFRRRTELNYADLSI
jgi:hypothetical protein